MGLHILKTSLRDQIHYNTAIQHHSWNGTVGRIYLFIYLICFTTYAV